MVNWTEFFYGSPDKPEWWEGKLGLPTDPRRKKPAQKRSAPPTTGHRANLRSQPVKTTQRRSGGGSFGRSPKTARDITAGMYRGPDGSFGQGLGVLARPEPPNNPMMDLLNSLGSNAPSVDITAMLREQYQPQFDAIAAMEEAARAENERAKAALTGAYNSAVGDIRGQAPVLQGFYDAAKKSVNDSSGSAVGTINQNFDESEAKQAALRARLGLDEAGAVSEAAQEADRQQAFLASLVEANKAANTGLLDNNAATAQTFNTQQSNITQQEGTNAQAGLAQLLGRQLGELGLKRADLMSQQAGQGADLTMRQADRDWEQQRWFAEQLMASQRAQAEAEAARMESMTPWERAYMAAMNATGGDEGMANRALDLIRSASMERGMGNTVADFLRFVAERNGADGRPGRGYLPSNLLSNIASSYWQIMDPRAPIGYDRRDGSRSFTGGGY